MRIAPQNVGSFDPYGPNKCHVIMVISMKCTLCNFYTRVFQTKHCTMNEIICAKKHADKT